MNNRNVYTVTATTERLLKLEDAKAYIVDVPEEDDAMILGFIDTSTEWVKTYLRVGLLTETLELRMDRFGDTDGDDRLVAMGPGVHTGHRSTILGQFDAFYLPYAPVQSITSIITYDRDNSASTLAAATYSLSTVDGKVYLNEGYSWPTSLRAHDAVHVQYVTGYGVANVPGPIKQFVRQHVAEMYDCRAACEPSKGLTLLSPYRRVDALGFEL